MRPRALLLAPLLAGVVGCLPSITTVPGLQTDDDAGAAGPTFVDAGATDAPYDLPVADPHALLGVDPGHGPFPGGQRRVLHGNGFTSKSRVWFGATEVAAADVVAIDPSRVQVVAPAGPAGPADVRVQQADDASTSRTLVGGYHYDAFYADPATGSTSGGTVVRLHGDGTAWTAGTTVRIGNAACAGVVVTSATALSCTTPKGPAGARSVTVSAPGAAPLTVLDAFTYADSDNGFKGGLSGAPLAASLRVLAFDNWTGDAIEGALVVAGDALDQAATAHTDAAGVATLAGAFGPRRSVTVAAACHQAVTFVDVPVDTVTAYLDPIVSPACGSGDPTLVGGSGGDAASVSGELVWPSTNEFKRGLWAGVPQPLDATERQAAYVLIASGDPGATFSLPDAALAVTPDATGSAGYAFAIAAPGGNLALYALAGIERTKAGARTFTPFVMGLARGVSTVPGGSTGSVFLRMGIPLDHALAVHAVPPAATPRGPDRLALATTLQIGNDGYAPLPGLRRVLALPGPGDTTFVGLPPLDGALADAWYVATARAGSGASLATPMSVVGAVATRDTSTPVALDAFVQVPQVVTPGPGGAWDGQHLAFDAAPGGAPPDLRVVTVSSGGGLESWTLAIPAGSTEVTLPDVRNAYPSVGSIMAGPVAIGVTSATVAAFDYGNLRYRQLASRGWTRWATDVVTAHVP